MMKDDYVIEIAENFLDKKVVKSCEKKYCLRILWQFFLVSICHSCLFLYEESFGH
jgi:hypothetical protein